MIEITAAVEPTRRYSPGPPMSVSYAAFLKYALHPETIDRPFASRRSM
jgi:hypothetical protein